jgi:hypothetical protein
MATASRTAQRNRSRKPEARDNPAFIDDILSMAGSLANSRREYAAAQLGSLAESVRQITDTMPNVPTVRAYAITAAESLEELADYVSESEVNDMIVDAREFTRRHPLATFGGSIAAGLLLTQIVQARGLGTRPASRTRRNSQN